MADVDMQRHNEDRPSGQNPRVSVAQARTSLGHVGPASSALFARARRVPAQARFAVFGFIAMSAIISVAAILRSGDTLDALEGKGRPRASVPLTPTRTNTQLTTGAAALSAAPTGTVASASAPVVAKEDLSAAAGRAPPESTEGILPEAMRAPDGDLAAARLKGLAALEQLSSKYPRDPEVLRSLLEVYTRQKNQLAAMGVAGRLLDSKPQAADDNEVQQSIMIAVNGAPSASAEALKLLATKMGARGIDLLYDLLTAPKVGKLPKDRATEFLHNPDVRDHASKALLIALDLRETVPCKRKTLFARAREEGDARALAFLKPLTATDGCGFLRRSDCFGCLEPRKELYDTVTMIQKRIEQGAPPK